MTSMTVTRKKQRWEASVQTKVGEVKLWASTLKELLANVEKLFGE